jgi:hypothetical protein
MDMGMVYPDGKPMPMPDDLGLLGVRDAILSDPANWIVAQNHVGRYWLSTIWLAWHEEGEPFETALFFHGLDEHGDRTDVLDSFGDPIGPEILARLPSWYEALRFHLMILSLLQLRFTLPSPQRAFSWNKD